MFKQQWHSMCYGWSCRPNTTFIQPDDGKTACLDRMSRDNIDPNATMSNPTDDDGQRIQRHDGINTTVHNYSRKERNKPIPSRKDLLFELVYAIALVVQGNKPAAISSRATL